MMILWRRLTARINAMTLRERFLLFASVVAVLGAFTNIVFISPLLEQQKILVAQIEKKSSDMDTLRDEVSLEILKRGRDRVAELNSGTLKVQADIEMVEREIAALTAAGSDTVAISAMLTRILRRSDKVSLVRVAQAGSASATAVPVGGAGASRGGLDITLSGNYLDLMEYLAALEKALPQARWGSLRLKAETTPAQLTVRIVTGPVDS